MKTACTKTKQKKNNQSMNKFPWPRDLDLGVTESKTTKRNQEANGTNEEPKARPEMRGERIYSHAEGREVLWEREMEHSRTALPTCYGVLYYNGDFPVAPSFTQRNRAKEREREKGGKGERLPQSRK